MPEPTRPAAARLTDGLDGWRRQVARRRCMAAARRWSVITAGAALAGALAGRLDGRPLVSVTSAVAVTLVIGALDVARSRQVSADEAARFGDARFGLDEQVATALYFSGADHHNPLVSSLIERAAELVADKRDIPGPRLAPAYGEWAVMAVTAAAVAAAAAAPGPHPGSGGANGAGWVSAASGVRATAVGSGIHPGPAGPGGTARPAAATGRTGTRLPGTAAASSLAGRTGSTGGAVSGGTRPQPSATAGPQASSSADGPQAPGGAQATPTAPGAGSGMPGTAQPASGSTATGNTATGSTATGTPGTPGTTRSGAVRGAAGTRGGVPGGDTAGTRPGTAHTPSATAQPLPNSGDKVLLIVLPGGGGAAAGRAKPGSPAQQPEGSGGIATVTGSLADGGSTVYVAPDANEVPFGDQALVGRYF